MIGECKAQCIGRAVEDEQETVCLVDLASAPLTQQVARSVVVRRRQRGPGVVPQAFRVGGAVDQVGQQQGDGCRAAHRVKYRAGARDAPPWPRSRRERHRKRWNDCRYAFLHDRARGAAGVLQHDRDQHFPGQFGVVELVGVAQALVRHELHVSATERVAATASPPTRERQLWAASSGGAARRGGDHPAAPGSLRRARSR